MSFLANLEWRRAEKSFVPFDFEDDPDSIEKVMKVINAMQQAPSSFGVQPYHIIVVQSQEMKDKLFPASYNQQQVKTCHTLFVICARSDVAQRVEECIQVAHLPENTAAFYRHAASHNDLGWAARQAYIALGFGLAACAELKLASCPMEGFDTQGVKKVLSLPDTLTPMVYLAVGGKNENESTYPRFRFPKTDLFSHV